MPSTLQSSRYSVYYSVYLHYQYKSTNTDAAVDAERTAELQVLSLLLSLLALPVQEYKY
jgi:hypothetical protein